MNAPTRPEALEGTLIHPALDQLVPSKTQPRVRKGFDEASLNELAASINAFGVAQPILIREQANKKYEIVCGERRWRAAKIAGLPAIPALLRTLTDAQVVHIQLIENVQREDLDALEEAEGYEKLMKETDPDTNKPYTADKIAKLQGTSKATIYARIKLLDLCTEAREAFYKGELDASRALLLARIPVHKLQLNAMKEILAKATYNTSNVAVDEVSMSYRRARDHIQEHYMLDLDRAVFDTKDAMLVPKAGDCVSCKHRTGNARELFDDVKGKDVCTDPSCFAIKKTAHVLAIQKKAEAEGNQLITGKEAKKIIQSSCRDTGRQLNEHGYAKLDDKIEGDEKGRTWKQALKETKLDKPTLTSGKPVVQKTIIENPNKPGEMLTTVSIEQATKQLREAGFEITMKSQVDTSSKDEEKRAKERDKEKQELAIENAFRSRLFDTLHAKIEADMLDPSSATFPKLYRMLAIQLWQDHDYYDVEDITALMRKYTTLPNAEEGKDIDWQSHISEFSDNLPNLTPAQHLMLCIELPLLVSEITTSHSSSEAWTMLEMAGELGIDAEGMRKEVAAQEKSASAATKKAEKEVAKKPATTKKTTATPTKKPSITWPFPTLGAQKSGAA